MPGKAASQKHKVLIVEDHPVFANGLASLLNQDPALTVCGTATSIGQARSLLRQFRPHLMILDLGLPDGSGFELISEITTRYPGIGILVLSMAEEVVHARRALRAGARGYLMKHEPPQRLLHAALEVLAGRTCVSNRLQSEILRALQGPAGLADPAEQLTERERDILRLIGEGKTAAVIARQLGISPKTVDSYRTFLKRKLGVRDSHELMCRAIQLRMGEQPPR